MPTRHRLRHRPTRLVGALTLSGALLITGAACTSSGSTASTEPTNTSSGRCDRSRHVQVPIARRGRKPHPVAHSKSGSIDIAELFTFTPDIAKNGWVTLEDDKHLQAADNFVPLISTKANTDGRRRGPRRRRRQAHP